MKKKVLFHQDNALCHKSIEMMAKLQKLHFKFCTHSILQIRPPVTTDCLQTSKKCFRERFGSNEEVILETEVYFEAKDKSFYKKGIELLEKHWN